jgi:hypothetical protein
LTGRKPVSVRTAATKKNNRGTWKVTAAFSQFADFNIPPYAGIIRSGLLTAFSGSKGKGSASLSQPGITSSPGGHILLKKLYHLSVEK